jgi:hypothetical protein
MNFTAAAKAAVTMADNAIVIDAEGAQRLLKRAIEREFTTAFYDNPTLTITPTVGTEVRAEFSSHQITMSYTHEEVRRKLQRSCIVDASHIHMNIRDGQFTGITLDLTDEPHVPKEKLFGVIQQVLGYN